MSDDRPSRDLDKIIVRLPDGMRDRLAAAAKENKRSSNAEVVDRLERSFSRESARVLTTIHVTLDAEGKPISWDEIHEHLQAISKAGQVNVAMMQVHVITPDLMSSRLREEHADALAKHYRALLKRPKMTD